MANFPLPKGYQRLGKFPIDETEIFTSDASARAYATSPSAYPGQKISVVKDASNLVDVYTILPDGSLAAIGGSVTSLTADNGLTITNNVVELGGIYNKDISINLNNNSLTFINSDSSILIIDGSSLKYGSDFSNYFTDQSLVNKAYVDSHGGGAGITWSSQVDSSLIPKTTSIYNLGSSTNRFNDVYLSGDIYLNANKVGFGHSIEYNGSVLPLAPTINFVSNGIGTAIAEYDSLGQEIDITPRFQSLFDVNPTGLSNGDIWKYDATSDKIVPQSTNVFTDILRNTEVELSSASNGILSTYIPSNYSIQGIKIKSSVDASAYTVSLGTTLAGNEISSIYITPSLETYLPLRKRWFSSVNDTDIYVSGITSGKIELEFIFHKGVISDEISKYNIKEIYENPTYYMDNNIKIIKYSYVFKPTMYYEERFEYIDGSVSKLEIKDDPTGYWVRKTNFTDASGHLIVPTIINITSWSII